MEKENSTIKELLQFLQSQRDGPEQMQEKAEESLLSFTKDFGFFEGTNITNYLKNYSLRMEIRRIPERLRVSTFEFAVDYDIRYRIKKLESFVKEDWISFQEDVRKEFSLNDADRETKETFQNWVRSDKVGLSIEEILHQFETKFKRLTTTECKEIPDKIILFLQAIDQSARQVLVQNWRMTKLEN